MSAKIALGKVKISRKLAKITAKNVFIVFSISQPIFD
jgi:hypothetical protein